VDHGNKVLAKVSSLVVEILTDSSDYPEAGKTAGMLKLKCWWLKLTSLKNCQHFSAYQDRALSTYFTCVGCLRVSI